MKRNSLVETTLKYSHSELFYEKMFMSMKSLKKSAAPESFLNKVSSWRFATLLKKRLRRKVEEFSKQIILDKKLRQILEIKQE